MDMPFIHSLIKSMLLSSGFFALFIKIHHIKWGLLRKVLYGLGYVVSALIINAAIFNVVAEPFKTCMSLLFSLIYLLFLLKRDKEKFLHKATNTFIDMLIAFAFNYTVFLMSTYLSAIILVGILYLSFDDVRILLLAAVFDFAVIKLLCRSKLYLKVKGAKGSGVIWALLVLVVFSVYPLTELTEALIIIIPLAAAILCVGMVFWWKKETANSFNSMVKENQLTNLQGTLDKMKLEFDDIAKDNKFLASQNHETNSRILAMKSLVYEIISKSSDKNIVKEAEKLLSAILTHEEISDAKRSKELYGKVLPKTGDSLIDGLIEEKLAQSIRQNIEFHLFVNNSIKGLANILALPKQLTLIGDLTENAIIALKHSKNNEKYINVYIGKADGIYEITVEDNGIPFELNTLVKLGKEQITTHAGNGGSGNGYVSLFNFMDECGMSLIITEESLQTNPQKQITVRFDGQRKYIICSPRAEALKKQKYDNPKLELRELHLTAGKE